MIIEGNSMINKRSISIIKTLLGNKILTVNELSEELGVSERTIRYDIDKINSFLLENNFKIITKKSGIGLIFDLNKNEKASLKQIIDHIDNYNYIMSENERIIYIIFWLLKSDKYLTTESIGESISVSRSTIVKDLYKVNEWVEKNNMILDSRKAHGIIIKATEENIRKAIIKILRYLNKNDIFSNECSAFRENIIKELLYDNIGRNFIEKCIKSAEKQLDYIFSDEAFDSVLMNIMIQISRIKAGKIIKIDRYEILSLKNKKEYLVAAFISTMIAKKFIINIPEDEVAYIAVLLLSGNVTNIKNIDRENWIKIRIYASKLIENFEKVSGLNFNNDNQLFDGLLQHLRPMISRIKHDVILENPLLSDIKKSFSQTFKRTRLSIDFLEKELNKKFSDDEIGYISIYFQTAIERKLSDKKYAKNVLIICAAGLGTAKFVENKIRDLFDIKIIKTTSSRHYKEFLKNKNDDTYQVDLIVSTVKIDERNIKTVYVNPILSDENISELSKYLSARSSYKMTELEKSIMRAADDDNRPDLSELINRDVILLNQSAGNWQEAVKIGGELLYKNHIVEIRYIDEMIKTISEMGSYVAILPGIAMPHARPEKGSSRIGLSLLTLKNGVNFGNKENDPIRIIISISSIDSSAHAKALEQLMNIMDREDFYNTIVNADSKDEVIDYIKKYAV